MLLLPFEHWICILLAIGLAMLLGWQYARSHRQRYLLMTHSSEGWTLRSGQPVTCVSGALIQSGYRSAWLIILVIQSDDTVLHRVAIWHDQVSSCQFSYLHQQLAFAADPPARRHPLLWVRDCIGMPSGQLPQLSMRGNRTLRTQTRSRSENTLD